MSRLARVFAVSVTLPFVACAIPMEPDEGAWAEPVASTADEFVGIPTLPPPPQLPPGCAPKVSLSFTDINPEGWARSDHSLVLKAVASDREDGSDLSLEWSTMMKGANSHAVPSCNDDRLCTLQLPASGVDCVTRYTVAVKATDSDGWVKWAHLAVNVYDAECEGAIPGAPLCAVDVVDIVPRSDPWCTACVRIHNDRPFVDAGPTVVRITRKAQAAMTFKIVVPPIAHGQSYRVDVPEEIGAGVPSLVEADVMNWVDEEFSRFDPRCSLGTESHHGESNNVLDMTFY